MTALFLTISWSSLNIAWDNITYWRWSQIHKNLKSPINTNHKKLGLNQVLQGKERNWTVISYKLSLQSFLNKSISYRERLDGPDNTILLWGVLYWSHRGLELWRVSIIRDWNYDLHIVGCWPPLKLGFGLNHVLHSAVCVPFNHRLYPDQRLHLRVALKVVFLIWYH